jgi:hypothetical protein
MMRDASEHARKSADACACVHGQKLGTLVYLRQGEISIRAEDESSETSEWNSSEAISINKRLRLVVQAGFSKSL